MIYMKDEINQSTYTVPSHECEGHSFSFVFKWKAIDISRNDLCRITWAESDIEGDDR
jgi:hypothetical protein